jgi:hypothetical protein
VPTWAWLVGGLGGAVAVGALGWAVFGEHCDLSDERALCSSTMSDELFAPLLAVQGLSLLTVPIMYALKPRGSVRVALGPNGALQLSWSGTL